MFSVRTVSVQCSGFQGAVRPQLGVLRNAEQAHAGDASLMPQKRLKLLFIFCLAELSWFNWCLPGSCLLSLLLILCFRESYDRLYLDVVVSV